MKTCKDISELLSESMDRRLTWRERWAVRMHFFHVPFMSTVSATNRFLAKDRWSLQAERLVDTV